MEVIIFMSKLTPKQKIFCNEYIKDFNSKSAAVRAGYDAKKAEFYANQNLNKLEVRNYIDLILNQKNIQIKNSKNDIANADEVMKYLTDIMRGDGSFDDVSSRERIKAAELLGKRYSLFSYNLKTNDNLLIQIIDNIPPNSFKNGDENG